MEDHVGAVADRRASSARVGDVGGDGIDVGRKIFEALRWAHIEEGEAIDRVSLKRAFGDQARRQLAPDHPRSAGDKDVHSIKLNGCYSAMPPSTRCAWPVM
jgi:hypothetical protein